MKNNTSQTINRRYLSVVSDEPKQMLQPISGYTHEPLLTLEEACEPLLNIVPRLPAHIWVAKQNSKNPSDGLTQDESAAIHLYTMEWDTAADEVPASLYAHLNRTLKQIDRTKLRPWFRYLKLFLTALAKLPSASRQIVWRGVRKNYSEDYPPGEEVTWWAFSSCTRSLSVLESDQYLGKTGTRTLFSIEAMNGRTIRAHSHFTTEDEILLLPGTFFEVKSRLNPAPDLYIIHLKQKIPPHDLLDPPFEGAVLFPSIEYELANDYNARFEENRSDKPKRDVTGYIYRSSNCTFKNSKKNSTGSIQGVNGSGIYDRNLTIYPPVSVAYAFYSFDQNVQDLYNRHDGQINGPGLQFIPGYVGTGMALRLDQAAPTSVSIRNPFNLSGQNFTIEGFIILFNNSINATLIELSSNMSLSFIMGRFTFAFNERYEVPFHDRFPLHHWVHFAVVYSVRSNIRTYINGEPIGRLDYTSNVGLENRNVTMIIGTGFQGIIDQLSISLEAKTDQQILWDSTVAAYYPLDGDQNNRLLDYGPNSLNASSAGTQSVNGPFHNGLNFVASGAYYQANGFTMLNIVNQSFSIALWVRLENEAGIFLTVANSMFCLLVLGIRHSDNRTIAYLPNATNMNTSVILLGSLVPTNQWIHIAFIWGPENQARLYQNAVFQARNNQATKLNKGPGEAMSITLGKYHGVANCSGAEEINMEKQFSGSIDELFILSRPIKQDEIEKLNSTIKS